MHATAPGSRLRSGWCSLRCERPLASRTTSTEVWPGTAESEPARPAVQGGGVGDVVDAAQESCQLLVSLVSAISG